MTRTTLLLLCVVAFGCGSAPEAERTPTPSTSTMTPPTIPEPAPDPQVAAFDRLRPALEAAFRDAAADNPGATAAVVGAGGVWLGAEGRSDLQTGTLMTPDTSFYLGSLSKPITAAATLALADAERVELDAPLTRYLPALRCGGEETVLVRHLLTHTAGIPREGGMEYWFTGVFPTAEELSTQLVEGALQHTPGETWQYSNVGYAALGALLSQRHAEAPTAFEDVIEARVFRPLGMRSSRARSRPEGLATAYTAVGVDTGREGRAFAGLGTEVEGRKERVYHDANAMAPAFGMSSSARDLSRFVGMLLGHVELLSEPRRAQMLELQHPFESDPQSGWTYGLRRTHDDHGELHRHVGWFAAYRSQLQLRVERGFGVVVLTGSDDGHPEALVAALEEVLLAPTETR